MNDNSWLEKGLAYKVVKGNNDDWYWMYAAMSSSHNTMVGILEKVH